MCQLIYLEEMAVENSRFEDSVQVIVRKYRWYKKRVLRRLHKNHLPVVSGDSGETIKPGDRVRVRSWEEIAGTLDKTWKTHGCTFQKGMVRFCEGEYVVLKQVNSFYDEVKQRTCKCRGILLLEDARCNGKTAYLRPCDRGCYYFWNQAWLERVPL